MQELRRSPRFPTTCPVSVRRADSDLIDSWLLDISRSGAKLYTQTPDSMLPTATGTLISPDRLEAEFEVSWSESVPTKNPGFSICGVEFLAELSQNAIDSFASAPKPRFEFIDITTLDETLVRLGQIWGTKATCAAPVINVVARIYKRCHHIIIDHRYWDEEYIAEFNALYHGLHRQPLYSKRLLFYEGNGEQSHLVAAMSLRPLGFPGGQSRFGQVGKALVSPPVLCTDEPSVSYHGMCVQTPVYALGGKLPLRAFPFAQQDQLGSRCAHIDVRMAVEYLHRHLRLNNVSLEVIRNLTASSAAIAHPISGMIPEDIVDALAQAGCDPVVYGRKPVSYTTPAVRPVSYRMMVEYLHIYIDSGLPVILQLANGHGPAHTVCAVGHTIDRGKRRRSMRSDLSFRTTTDWVRDILVHDDLIGPQLLLRIDRDPPYRHNERMDAVWLQSLEGSLTLMYVPLPKGVHVPVNSALRRFSIVISDMRKSYRKSYEMLNGPLGDSEFLRALEGGQLTACAYLDIGKRMLSNLTSLGAPTVAEQNDLLRIDWPKYVWVAEFSIDNEPHPPFNSARTHAVVVLDATTPLGQDSGLLYLKFPGLASGVTETQAGSPKFEVRSSLDPFGSLNVRNYEAAGWNWPPPNRV